MIGRSVRDVLNETDCIHVPLTFDPHAARIAEDLGFDAVLVGGAAVAKGIYGTFDGAIGPSEVLDQVTRVRMVTEIPIIVDLDDAGGRPHLVRRHVRAAELAGASAVLIEDIDCANRVQWDVKRGQWSFDFYRLQAVQAATDNIRTAVISRRFPETMVIARTDALVADGYSAAAARAAEYVSAGADAVFIVGLPADDVDEMASALGVPIMNMVDVAGNIEQNSRAPGLRIAIHVTAASDPYQANLDALVRCAEQFPSPHRGIRSRRELTSPADWATTVVAQEVLRYLSVNGGPSGVRHANPRRPARRPADK